MSQNLGTEVNILRQALLKKRKEQAYVDTRRGELLIRGRIFTWLSTNRTRLTEHQLPVPTRLAAYWALEHEPDLLPLLYQLVDEHNYEISLPCVVGPNQPLVFRPWVPDMPMKTGAFGIQEPDTDAFAPTPEIVLVPTLGYNRDGDRIGYGKGFYDRTLSQLRDDGHIVTTLGVAWAVGDISDTAYQAQEHDYQLDAILTDQGWAKAAPEL